MKAYPQEKKIPKFLIDFQRFIRAIIDDYPQIVEIYLEENQPNYLIAYIITKKDLPYKEFKQIARFQNRVLDHLDEELMDFRIIEDELIGEIEKRQLVKII